jgi:hypothetical protein
MSFNNQILRDYIINNFLKEQISIEKSKSLNESELDNFIEMPDIEKSNVIEEEKSKPKSNYKYLDNDILSKEFCLNREREILEIKKYMISLCFFNVNEDLKTPFLEFLFDNQSGEFSFPKKELQMDVITNLYKKENEKKINIENTTPFQKMNTISDYDIDDETEIETDCDEVEIEFFDQCSKFAQEIAFLPDHVIKQRYLGFIEKNDILYIIIDITNINILENIHNNNKNGYFIGIMDEIVNKKKIFETSIDKKIIELFESSPLLKNIYDYNNKEVIFPKLVYLCIGNEPETDIETNNIILPVPVPVNNEVEEETPNIIESDINSIEETSDIINTKSPFEEKTEEKEIIHTVELIEKNDQILQKGGSIYKNAYYDMTDTIKSQSPILSLANPKVNHPLFDNIYLFTSEPFIKTSQKGLVQEIINSVVNDITATDEINKIKRYALQIDSVKYYKDIDVKTLIEQNESINPSYDVYCFYEDGREYWAVKSINNFTEI